jgi:hypothetical protein
MAGFGFQRGVSIDLGLAMIHTHFYNYLYEFV